MAAAMTGIPPAIRSIAGGRPERATGPYSDRTCSAEETWLRIVPLLAHYGITRVSRLTGLDRIGIPVWNAVMPNALSIVINQGKGITDIDAKVSAAMEALERAVAAQPDIASRLACISDLRALGDVADPLPALTATRKKDLADDDVVDWVAGSDILSEHTCWVPRDAVMLDQTRDDCRYWQSSDGLASGNTREEAMLHGLLERIERDAEVLWYLLPLESRAMTCIDPASFMDPVLDGMVAQVRNAGLALQMFDMTSDIAVPCIIVFIGPANIAEMSKVLQMDVTAGSGAHPNATRAAIRAVTECAQARLTYISGARDDIDEDVFSSELPASLRQSFAFVPQPPPQWPPLEPDGRSLLEIVRERLVAAGIPSAIAVPLTPDDHAFAVVKMIVPQLENPEGARLRRFGQRAIARVLFR